MLATKVAGGRIQYLYAESVCDYGFKRRAYEALQKTKTLGIEYYGIEDTEFDSTSRSRKLQGVAT